MKTQYTSLVKIKKQHLDKMELSVASCNETIHIIKQKIKDSYNELASLEIPQGGDFSLFRQMQLLKTQISDEIGFNKYNLQMAESALMKAMQQLKTANIEHEKFKYLETTEIEKVLKAQKIKEEKDLDEVALMIFNRKNSTNGNP
ncbi:flagellar FliJ family protein [Sulfurimonas sp. MAG313]|nr:flagellar export protein FliJ [Sulfurimonas sp. MAG313]MDF1880835.1 flagellar FliJ family protein [Sulfurimonas sp. MAG313]